MRLKTLVALLAFLAVACSTNPVVGKWRATRVYDFRSQNWTELRTDALVEVSSNGKFKATLPDGSQRIGEYELDETVNPHRFIATDNARRAVRGIYKVEGDKLTVRGTDRPMDSEMPAGFDLSDNKTTFPLVELKREKE